MQADGVLWSCSAFGSCIEKAANIHSTIPVLKPNEAMQEQIVSPENGGASLVLSMFEPTLPSIERELFQLAQAKNVPLELELAFVEDALAAKNGGELDKSANMIADRAVELWARRVEREPERAGKGKGTVALAMFSMAFAKSVTEAKLEAAFPGAAPPVLTSPDSAVMKLRSLIEG